ncbi:MAG TPA: hypothetical protein VGG17_01960 [Acidimicrobiales bacterium]
MTGNSRQRATSALFAVVVLAYAWFATGSRSFSPSAYVLLAAPSLIALLLYGALGGFSPRRYDIANYYRMRSSHMSWRRAAPWLVAAILSVALESIALALGGRSASVPTLSTTVDHLLVNHGVRFVLFAVWLAVGASSPRRLVLLRRGVRE